MDVSVRHVGTGHSCVVGVPEGGTVAGLKADALEEMFTGSSNTTCEAEGVAAHIEGCEEELDDAKRVADTGLEDGGAVRLVPRWPHVKAPAVYTPEHACRARCIALSRCGRLCAVGYSDGHATVFGTTAADLVADFTHGDRSIMCTAFSVCGTWLATCSESGTVCVWLTATWEEVCKLDHNSTMVYSAAWTHCGRLVSGDKRGKVRVWSLEGTPSATVLEGITQSVRGIAVSRTSIYASSEDSRVRVWDINTLAHTHTLDELTEPVCNIALTNDEQHLLLCSWDNYLKVWCTTTLTCLRAVQRDYDVTSLAVSQPGDVAALRYYSSTKLYRLSTGECLGEVPDRGLAVALSPCGRWVFTPTNKSSVSVCAVASV